MMEESEMEESEMEESEMEKSKKGEKKVYSEEDMIKCLMEEAGSIEEAREKMDEYGYELVKKDDGKKSYDEKSIEEELGMKRMMPKVSVIRLSAARKALDGQGKK